MVISGDVARLGGGTSLAAPFAILPRGRFFLHQSLVRSSSVRSPWWDETRAMVIPITTAADRAGVPHRESSRARENRRGRGATSHGSNNRAPEAADANRPRLSAR